MGFFMQKREGYSSGEGEGGAKKTRAGGFASKSWMDGTKDEGAQASSVRKGRAKATKLKGVGEKGP